VQFENALPKFGGSLLPKIGGSSPPIFDIVRRFRNLTANLTTYIFGTKHDMDDLEEQFWELQKSLQCSKISLIHKRPKMGPSFYPCTLRKFYILPYCQAFHR